MTSVIQAQSSPYLYATLASQVVNVTGDGTSYTAVFDTSTTIQGIQYNTSTGIVTCIIPGEYIFSTVAQVGSLTSSHTLGTLTLVSTFGSFQANEFRIGLGRTAANTITYPPSVFVVPMAAGDTARIDFMVSGSTKTVSFDTLSTLTVARIP